MSNPHKGEVSFKAGEKEYILSFSANALVEIEEVLGFDFNDLIEKFKSKDIKLADMRVVFWQGLLDHHEELTLDDAKKILKRLRPAEMGDLIGKAFVASMPPAPESGASPQEPGEPASGTGPASSMLGVTSEEAKPNSGG